jgi:hypothetical protein
VCRAWPWRNDKRWPAQIFAGRENTAGLGVEGAPIPVAAHACGMWEARQGPGVLLVLAGKPEVTKAQVPGGNRMLKKRMPVRRKATGNRDSTAGSSAGRPA